MKQKNIRHINCVCCPQYCQNKNKNKIIKILKDFEKENVDEVIFCCEVLNGYMKTVAREVAIKIAYQDKKGKINYF